eukprot:CAMPEP_0173246536 /NCGR_PEP_ID=MMETSP1142-20121109/17374_1 /TAXON_ID=483371 /ORGANISM="non described non described, Strain CCMP2298" /LENGTH=47 /DNA_ID= /DNA_START= /DNA_END= /DNA_ORIENTATION=
MKTSSKLCTSSTLSNQLTTRSTLYEPAQERAQEPMWNSCSSRDRYRQ